MDSCPNTFRKRHTILYDTLRGYQETTKVYYELRDKDIVQKHVDDIQKVSFTFLSASLF